MGGSLLEVVVVPADTDERTCALAVLIKAKKRPWSAQLQTIFADSGFAGQEFEAQVQEQLGFGLEIVHRDKEQAGFMPLPKRWLIECPRGGSSSRCLVAKEETEDSAATTRAKPTSPAPPSKSSTFIGGCDILLRRLLPTHPSATENKQPLPYEDSL